MSKKIDKIVRRSRQVSDESGVVCEPSVKEWFSTGCTVLDLAIADRLPGGIPVGRIVQIYGGNSTCKTVLGTTILGYAQRNKCIGFFLDVEHTFDEEFATLYGLKPNEKDTFRLSHPVTLSDLFDKEIKNILELEDKRKRAVVIDSLTALTTEVELKDPLEGGGYNSSRAKQNSKGIRRCLAEVAGSTTTLIFIDQTRDNITGFGAKEVTSGGRALEFYASTRIYLKSDGRIKNTSGKAIGIWVKFEIAKNKVAVPFRTGRFRILFDYGLDDIWTNLFFLSEFLNGTEDAKKKTTKIIFSGQEKRISTMVAYIEDNNLEQDLQKKVEKVWRKLYQTEDRKKREW